jgi:tripartite-type tricarboxylate transporter receptor subunit TctC
MGLPEWTDVPYQGAAKALTDLVGGHVDGIVAMIANFVSAAESGDIRLIAVTTKARSPVAPQVPTIAETTPLTDFDAANWTALLAPQGTPRPIVERLAAEVSKALRDPEMVKKLATVGLEPAAEGPDALAKSMAANVSQWREVVKQAGMNPI